MFGGALLPLSTSGVSTWNSPKACSPSTLSLNIPSRPQTMAHLTLNFFTFSSSSSAAWIFNASTIAQVSSSVHCISFCSKLVARE